MSVGQRNALEVLARARSVPHRQVQRAKVLLLAADGVANARIADEVGVTALTVRAWRNRFAEEGLAKLGQVRKGRGPKPSITSEQVGQIVQDTLHSKPKGETHWSTRSMARHAGVSRNTVQRVWHARGLKPHLVDTYKISNDPKFEEKLTDVVGLYLNPPENAIVLCMDELCEASHNSSDVKSSEVPDPGVGPHPAVAADKKGPSRHHDPRLQTQRHHHVVRRT
jgi:transposase